MPVPSRAVEPVKLIDYPGLPKVEAVDYLGLPKEVPVTMVGPGK